MLFSKILGIIKVRSDAEHVARFAHTQNRVQAYLQSSGNDRVQLLCRHQVRPPILFNSSIALI